MTEYLDPTHSFVAPMVPRLPCRQFETRACVDLSLDDEHRYRAQECDKGMCTRFPNRDKTGEQR